MYNEEQKMRFLDYQYPLKDPEEGSNRTRENATRVFEKLADAEQAWGADICTRSAEEINEALANVSTVRTHTTKNRHSLIKRYMKWCLENNIPGATDAYKDLEIANTMANNTVSGPADLQKYLDMVFAPESARTIEIIYRCYLWMAFSGMYESDTYYVKTTDVNPAKMLLTYNGINYPLYAESMLAFILASASSTFVFDPPRYADSKRVNRERERVDGNLLLRGFKGTPNIIVPSTWRSAFSTKIRSALTEGRVDRKVTYERARFSGVFYRAWLRECNGKKPTFKKIALEHIKRLGTTDPTAKENNIKQITKEYSRDYKAWKEAWNLSADGK